MREKIIRTTGLEPLDKAMGGLLIGDNVVWLDDSGSLAWLFCEQFLQTSRRENKPIIYVCFDRPPNSLAERLGELMAYDRMTILDCFTDGKGESSPVFASFYENGPIPGQAGVIRAARPDDPAEVSELLYGIHGGLDGDVRLVFDSLTGMQELWGGEEQLAGFYRHACPRLYELDTIAYWIMEKRAHTARLKAQIGQVAQVVVELKIRRGTTSLSVLKAEGRDDLELHKPHPYWVKDGQVHFNGQGRHAGGFNLGSRLKELRTKKGFSQTELARNVGVTPSTISQVESNLIYPSLPALVKMAEVLAVDVSSFFTDSRTGRIRSVFGPDEAEACRIESLPQDAARVARLMPLDFPGRGEAYLIEWRPGRGSNTHFFFHKGEEFGYVLSGEIIMRMDGQSHKLGPGHTIYLTDQTPEGWRNPGDEPARMLWVVLH